MAKHARRGLERQINIGTEDRAGITWFDTITQFMFANEIILAKSTAGKKQRDPGQTAHRKFQTKTAGEDLGKQEKSRDKSHGEQVEGSVWNQLIR